jgi:SAM-dependent methyltransferase
MPARVDYDRIASTYDGRYAVDRMDALVGALRELARETRAERILEAGCGTGHFLSELRGAAPRLYGIDLSSGMLRNAAGKGPLHLAAARSEQLPFAAESFDLVYCVNALHHFDDPRGFMREAVRCLRPSGRLAVAGMTVPAREGWYLYRYFDGSYETDLRRFPSWGTLLDWTIEAGLEDVRWRLVRRMRGQRVGREVLKDPFLAKPATSQLALLTDEAYAAGIARIEEALAAAEARGETLVFPIDIRMGLLVACAARR